MSEKKKVSLADMINQKLAQKKQDHAEAQQGKGLVKKTQSMSNQIAKKPSNQRRKMGT